MCEYFLFDFILNLFLFFSQDQPEIGKWHNKPFPLYERLKILVAGRYATGEGAISISELTQSQNLSGTPNYLKTLNVSLSLYYIICYSFLLYFT